MEFIIALVIGIAWGWWAREYKAKQHIEKMLAEHMEKPELDSESILVVKVEKHGESFYLYTEDTDEFVAQGKSLEELRDVVNKRYHGTKHIAIRKDESTEGLL